MRCEFITTDDSPTVCNATATHHGCEGYVCSKHKCRCAVTLEVYADQGISAAPGVTDVFLYHGLTGICSNCGSALGEGICPNVHKHELDRAHDRVIAGQELKNTLMRFVRALQGLYTSDGLSLLDDGVYSDENYSVAWLHKNMMSCEWIGDLIARWSGIN